MIKIHKKAQEELVGFAIIVIIVALILLFVLSFSLRGGRENVESFEVDSFIQSFLQYTTECKNNLENLSVQQLIFECNSEANCLDGKESCEILQTTLEEITQESWTVGPESPIKGYELDILVNSEGLLSIKEGNETNNLKSSKQPLPNFVEVVFKAYF